MKLQNKRNQELLGEYNYIRAFEPDAILSGSLALMIHEKIPERVANDIDIILPRYVDLSYIGKIHLHPEVHLDMSFTLITGQGVEVDVIVDPYRPWVIINNMKVSCWENIATKKNGSHITIW